MALTATLPERGFGKGGLERLLGVGDHEDAAFYHIIKCLNYVDLLRSKPGSSQVSPIVGNRVESRISIKFPSQCVTDTEGTATFYYRFHFYRYNAPMAPTWWIMVFSVPFDWTFRIVRSAL